MSDAPGRHRRAPDARGESRSVVRGGIVGIALVALVTAGIVAAGWLIAAAVLLLL